MMSYYSKNKENLDEDIDCNGHDYSAEVQDSKLRFDKEIGNYRDEKMESSSRKRRYYSHYDEKYSHRERHRRRHKSGDYGHKSRRYRSRHHRRESEYKGNLGSNEPESCKYEVETVKDLRHSNRDVENHKKESKGKNVSEIFEEDFNDVEESSPPKLTFINDSDWEGKSPDSNNSLNNNETQEEVREFDETLPPYYPAIEGCRSLSEFQCLNRIAEGTYGVVYRFRDKRTDDIVALKKLKMEKEKEGFPITSLREINTLLKGQHPNIVTVREIVVGNSYDKIFIVMDYIEHDLKSLIEMMRLKDQHFTPGEIKCLVKQLLAAVAHLHDNWILHRDLKTSNLLLSHNGILKVGDFGLAREYGSPLRPYTPIVVTLWYRAPELILGVKEYSTHIDMWSVGCIFAEFILMNAIFPGKSEQEQLNRIFKCLGTPTEKVWPGFNKLPVVQKTKFVNHSPSNLRKRFQMLSDLGLNFLLNLLTFDPNQRITAEDALKHPFFSEFPPPIDPGMFPKWPAKSELGHKKPEASSPKAPSGGDEYKKLEEEDGFRFNAETENTRIGAGFSLKF